MDIREVYEYIPILSGMGDFDMTNCLMDAEFLL